MVLVQDRHLPLPLGTNVESEPGQLTLPLGTNVQAQVGHYNSTYSATHSFTEASTTTSTTRQLPAASNISEPDTSRNVEIEALKEQLRYHEDQRDLRASQLKQHEEKISRIQEELRLKEGRTTAAELNVGLSVGK